MCTIDTLAGQLGHPPRIFLVILMCVCVCVCVRDVCFLLLQQMSWLLMKQMFSLATRQMSWLLFSVFFMQHNAASETQASAGIEPERKIGVDHDQRRGAQMGVCPNGPAPTWAYA